MNERLIVPLFDALFYQKYFLSNLIFFLFYFILFVDEHSLLSEAMSHHPPLSPTVGHPPQQKGGHRRRWWGWDDAPLLNIAGVLLCLFTVLWVVGIDIVLPFSLLLSATLGFLSASLLINNAHLCFCAQIVLAQLVGLLPPDDAFPNRQRSATDGQQHGDESQKRRQMGGDQANSNYIVPPWERVKIDARLNRELEELFETLLESYVNSWYTGLISTDTAFLLEVRHLIRHSSAKLISRLISVDLRSLLTNDLFPLILAHVERICRLTNEIFGQECRPDVVQLPASLVEFKVFDQWADDVHWAMRSNDNSDAYMRMVADLLVRHFVDDIRIGGCFVDEEHAKILNRNTNNNGSSNGAGLGGAAVISPAATKWSCHSSRHFLRELLFSSALIPALDAVADPDSLNRLMLNALSNSDGGDGFSTTGAAPPPDGGEGSQHCYTSTNNWQEEEPFLSRFVEPYYTNTPDSLLGLKLNDLVENPYLTKLFEMYLRDLNGPTHLLDCFMQARDIHMRIQKLNNAKFGDNCGNDQHIQREMGELCFDAWQLFSTFVHSNGPNRISLDGQIERDFSSVLESYKGQNSTGKCGENDQQQRGCQKRTVAEFKPLEKVIELIYQQVYQNLQYNYVIPFWQSENYLGYLCGAPPDVDELIGGSPSNDGALAERKLSTKMPEGSFSLAQFRKKLFNFITPSKEAVTPSSASSASLFHQWSISSSNASDDFGTFATAADIDGADGGGTIAMADLSRDMAKWRVSIDGVAQRRATNQTFYHIYSLGVERNDLPEECYTTPTANRESGDIDDEGSTFEGEEEEEEELPKAWTVGHRCEEFFALEDRLREHLAGSIGGGGNSANTLRSAVNGNALPDRKTTLQLLHNGRNNRALLETYRVHFERFLQQLLQQPSMKRSDLLYIFLTSEENSTGLFELTTGVGGGWRSGGSGGAMSFLPDLNPIRAMRKVGGKERGQNLKPFILNLLANTLAPPTMRTTNGNSSAATATPTANNNNMTTTAPTQPPQQSRNGGDTMSMKSETGTTRSVDGDGGSAAFSLCSTNKSKHCTTPAQISQLHFPTECQDEQQQQNWAGIGTAGWTRNFFDLFLFLSLHLGLLARFPVWLESLLCSLRTFVAFLFSIFARRKAAQVLDNNLLNVEMAVYLVRALHELILFRNVPPSSLSATPSQNSMTSSAPLGKPSTGEKRRAQLRQKAEMQQRTAQKLLPPAMISEQERRLRAELALHCVEKWVERTLPVSPLLRWTFGRFASVVSSAFAPFCSSAESNDDNDDQQQNGENAPRQRRGRGTTAAERADGSTGDEDGGGGEGGRVASVRLLFQCFQMPTLNRQLAFVLMDKVLQKVVVETPPPQQQQQQQAAEEGDRQPTNWEGERC